MNSLQEKFDRLSAILVKTPIPWREETIRTFCKREGISLEKTRRQKFDQRSLQELPFDGVLNG